MFANLFAIDFVLEKQKKKGKQYKSSMINLTTIFSTTPTSDLDFAVQQQQKMSIYSLPALTIVAVLLTWYFLASLRRSLLPSPPWKNNNTLTKNNLPQKEEESKNPANDIPISVNYHFTRQCNMSCGFCFHTATTSHMVSLEDALKGIRLLKDAGMRKINFAGGEPFLYPKILGKMVDFCKEVRWFSFLPFSFFLCLFQELERMNG